MKIVGIQGMTGRELAEELDRGAKFVIFHYVISLIVITFRRPGDIYFVRAGESAVGKGIGYSLLTMFLGWWGLPFGILYSFMALGTNFSGGKDVTQEVIHALNSN
jgi:hypothetical protein